jgi:hypothetical protein
VAAGVVVPGGIGGVVALYPLPSHST